MNLKVKIPGIELSSPAYNGSGSFEYGEYQWTEMDFQALPVLVLKTSTIKSKITPEKRQNLMSTKGTQVFNSIGLQNPPIEGVIAKIKEFETKYNNMPMIASASGDTPEEFAENVKILSEQNVVAVEINLSCPNVDKGGITYGTDPRLVEEVVRRIKAATTKPIHVKLTPNVTDIVAIGKAAERGGADALIAINTLLGFVCNPDTGEPVIARGYGGYSGPGIFPVALRAVHQLYKSVNIPIIGVGGITNTQDVIDMMSAGATAVQIVSATRENPEIFKQIQEELPVRLKEMGLTDVNELIGRSHKFTLPELFPGSYTNTVGPDSYPEDEENCETEPGCCK